VTSPPTPNVNFDVKTDSEIPDFNADVSRPLKLLAECPAYASTKCHELLAPEIGTMYVKDESTRMGLGSFKALGGVYAVAALIADQLRASNPDQHSAIDYASPKVRTFASSLTFTCASAGNHGLAVAAGARIFGANARIFLSRQVPEEFAGRLLQAGAEVVRSGETYEESVEAALDNSQSTNSVLLADSSWPGYWHPPSLVMEGYAVLADELRIFFETKNDWPTHVFLQAGVGGLAASIVHMIRKYWRSKPQIIIVEPKAAPCLESSAKAGRPIEVSGPISNMGRLDCKVPSLLAVKLLAMAEVSYVVISDKEAATACSELHDLGFASTPSGAAGFAGLKSYLATNGQEKTVRPLIIVTEGAL
jgi:diaminopropionate ammonia-lyase